MHIHTHGHTLTLQFPLWCRVTLALIHSWHSNCLFCLSPHPLSPVPLARDPVSSLAPHLPVDTSHVTHFFTQWVSEWVTESLSRSLSQWASKSCRCIAKCKRLRMGSVCRSPPRTSYTEDGSKYTVPCTLCGLHLHSSKFNSLPQCGCI